MRNYYNIGGPTLVGKQKNLPEALFLPDSIKEKNFSC